MDQLLFPPNLDLWSLSVFFPPIISQLQENNRLNIHFFSVSTEKFKFDKNQEKKKIYILKEYTYPKLQASRVMYNVQTVHNNAHTLKNTQCTKIQNAHTHKNTKCTNTNINQHFKYYFRLTLTSRKVSTLDVINIDIPAGVLTID